MCVICDSIGPGVTVYDSEPLPEAASSLERVSVRADASEHLLRCPCGALFHYWHHYEPDFSVGSWDEYHLVRLPDPAQGALSQALAATDRDQALCAALRDPEVAASAALLFAGWAAEGVELREAVVAACEALGCKKGFANVAAYKALLHYARRGPTEKARIVDALHQLELAGRQSEYGRTLQRVLVRR